MDYITGMTMIAVGTMGIDVSMRIINAIATSVSGIQTIIHNLEISTNHKNVARTLRELDLDNNLDMLKSLLKEINMSKHHTNTLTHCLVALHNSIQDIEQELERLQECVRYNSSLWFLKSWRSYSLDGFVDNLSVQKKILDQRTATLFEILKINNLLVSCEKNENTNDKSIILIE